MWVKDPDPDVYVIRESENEGRDQRDPKRFREYQMEYRHKESTKARHRPKDLAYSRRPEVIAMRKAKRDADPDFVTKQRLYQRQRRAAFKAARLYVAQETQAVDISK